MARLTVGEAAKRTGRAIVNITLRKLCVLALIIGTLIIIAHDTYTGLHDPASCRSDLTQLAKLQKENEALGVRPDTVVGVYSSHWAAHFWYDDSCTLRFPKGFGN